MYRTVPRGAVAAITAVVLSLASTGAAAAVDDSDSIPEAPPATVQMFESQILTSEASAKQLAEYDALTDQQKAQLVAALTSEDPLSAPGMVATSTESTTRVPVGASPFSQNSAKSGPVAPMAAATVYNVTSTSRIDVKWFGLFTVGYFKQIFRYQTDAVRVLSTQSCSGTYSGTGGLLVVSASTSFWTASNKGTCITIYEGSMFYKGSSAYIHKEMGMVVNGQRIESRWLRNI